MTDKLIVLGLRHASLGKVQVTEEPSGSFFVQVNGYVRGEASIEELRALRDVLDEITP